jgi:ankyrin repeat protein
LKTLLKPPLNRRALKPLGVERRWKGDLKAIGLLLQHGARIDRESKESGFTPLSRAVGNGQTAAIAALSTCGAQVRAFPSTHPPYHQAPLFGVLR